MKSLRETKGITLIALIITIIVMMILVGVTVNVALNGGLFDTTKTAAIKQEIATMQDMISAQEAKILADKAQNDQTLTVSAQEILSSFGVTSPEIVSLATEPAPEYVTNELVPPTGTCYKLDPSILGVDISRGQGTVEEGTAKDIFVLDSDKKIYYIREATIGITELTEIQRIQAGYQEHLASSGGEETEDFRGLKTFCLGESGQGGINVNTLIQTMDNTTGNIVCKNGATANINDRTVNANNTEAYLPFTYNGVNYILTFHPTRNTTIKLEKLVSLEVEGATVLANQKDIWKIKFADTENKYTLDTEGNIVGPIVLSEMEEYILGEYGTGRDYTEIFEIDTSTEPYTFTFINIPETLGSLTLERTIISETGEEVEVIFAQELNEEVNGYKIKIVEDVATEKTTTSAEYGVKSVVISRIGKAVGYKGMIWVVLYDDEEHGLQLATSGGYIDVSDTGVNLDEVAVDLNQNGTIDQLERHLYVYNNAPDLFKKTIVSSYNDIENAIVAKDSNGNCLVRTLGSNPLISNFGEDIYRTVVVSEETFPGYGKTSTWFEDNLNLEKNADGTGYVVKGTDIPFEFRTTDGITLGDSEAIEYVADYIGNSEFSDSTKENQPRRTMAFDSNSGSIVGGYSSYWGCSVECTFTISPDSAVADEPTKISSGVVMLLDQEKFAEFEEAAKNSGNYGDGSEYALWDLDQYVEDTEDI